MDVYYQYPMQLLANKIFAESFVVEREAEAAEAQDKLEYAEALTEKVAALRYRANNLTPAEVKAYYAKEKAERDANDAHLYA